MSVRWFLMQVNPLILGILSAWIAAGILGSLLVTLSDERRRRITQTLRDAIRLSNQTMGQAAQEAEIDQAQFQRQLEMVEGSLKRLAMQPDSFWQWLAVAITNEFGIPLPVQRAARLALASRGMKRMARMRSTDAREEQVS